MNHRASESSQAPAPPVEQMINLVDRQLSHRRRLFYRFVLAVVLCGLIGLISLWITEPGPLPPRLYIAFGCLALIGSSWVVVLSWVLLQKHCPTANDRIALSWTATFACGLSLFASVLIAAFRKQWGASIGLALFGGILLGAALMLLKNAYQRRSHLRTKLANLKSSGARSNSIVSGLILMLCLQGLSSTLPAQDDPIHEPPQLTLEKDINRHGAESGRLKVPMDRSQPNGKQIEIAFVRYPGNSDSPPTFLLDGGPGESGIKMARRMFRDGGKRIRRVLKGDIIGIDQRGVGDSLPNLSFTKSYGFSRTDPGSPEKYLIQIETAAQKISTQLKSQDIHLSSFNTLENATDLDDLRKALGYDRVNLWGTSYGSHLAIAMLNHFENGVDRVLLASPEGPDHTWKRPLHVNRCLERITQTNPELLTTIRRTIERLDKEPAKVPNPNGTMVIQINGFDIELIVWNALSRIETTRQIPQLFRMIENDNYLLAASLILRYRSKAGVGSVMKHAMDSASSCSVSRKKLINSETKDCVLGRVINFPMQDIQRIWNIEALGDDFRRPLESNRPVLIMVGDLDARTPVENARELMEGLPNGHLIVIKAGGHGFIPHPRLLEVAASFFSEDTKLPKEQTLQLD